ncbi:MAG: YraN family protein, partial [Marinobacterium sp.]
MNRKTIGNQGEQIAEQYLRKQGLKYLNRNVNYRFGEIDLVMLDSETIVFV